jgi:hypothetical protein
MGIRLPIMVRVMPMLALFESDGWLSVLPSNGLAKPLPRVSTSQSVTRSPETSSG